MLSCLLGKQRSKRSQVPHRNKLWTLVLVQVIFQNWIPRLRLWEPQRWNYRITLKAMLSKIAVRKVRYKKFWKKIELNIVMLPHRHCHIKFVHVNKYIMAAQNHDIRSPSSKPILRYAIKTWQWTNTKSRPKFPYNCQVCVCENISVYVTKGCL